MKVNGKFAALAGAALLLGSSVFAQEYYDGATSDYDLPEGFSFSYTLSSDLIKAHNISSTDNDFDSYEWWSEFGGLVNKFDVKYNSNLLAFQLAPKVKIGEPGNEGFWNNAVASGTYGYGGVDAAGWPAATGQKARDGNWFSPIRDELNEDDTGFGYDGLDWNFRFTPFDIVDFYLNSGVDIAGGGLPIGGGRYDAAKLGSDGLTIVLKPIQGLRLAASLPFSLKTFSTWDMLNAEDEDEDGAGKGYLRGPVTDRNDKYGNLHTGSNETSPIKFNVKLGADYNFKNLFSIGATWSDILNANNMQVGVYANITAIQGLDAGLGYTFNRRAQVAGLKFDFFGLNDYNGMFQIYGQHVVQLYAQYLIANKLSVGAEAAFNFFSEQSVYDMYFGAKVGYDISPKVNLGVKATFAFDFGTQLSYTDQDQNRYSPATALNVDAWKGKADRVKDDAFEQSYLKNAGSTNAAALYRFANADWKRANNYRNDEGVNSTRGFKGENTDWSGYQAATVISVQPSVTYTTGHNVFSGAVAVDYLTTAANDAVVESSDTNSVGDWFFKFPVSWTYNF